MTVIRGRDLLAMEARRKGVVRWRETGREEKEGPSEKKHREERERD